ncbi:MAG: thiamine S protein [Actinomycetia bacterium]|nr:thiamine S protein [Actinomycetes bacterium]
MNVVVRLAGALQAHAGGAEVVALDLPAPVTVGAVLDAVAEAHPAIGRRLRDEAGTLRRHVNVFVGPDNARDLDATATVVPDGTEVAILPAVSGG